MLPRLLTTNSAVRPVRLAVCAVVALSLSAVFGQSFFAPADPKTGPLAIEAPQSGRAYVVYVDAPPGSDISDRLQSALDRVRGYGGTVVLPPGGYTLTKTVSLAGSARRFPKGPANQVTLEGRGTLLTWAGDDDGAVLDLPACYFCEVRNLRVAGRRGTHWKKVIGIRHRGGIEREHHAGKNNRFEGLVLENLGVGVEVGGPFGPDLVGSTFANVRVDGVRIGFRLIGHNVAGMVFLNPQVSNFEEAGFKILALPGRQVRKSPDEPFVEKPHPRLARVLTDPDNEREIFQKELPGWLTREGVTYPTRWAESASGQKVLLAGGGSLDVTIYGLLAHSSHLNSWVIDTNWGAVRVYSARVEGMGGVFRSREPMAAGHYSNVLMDVSATSVGGLHGNAIELYGGGPLYLVGGTYRANVALGGLSQVYALGTRFEEAKREFTALLPADFQEKLDRCVRRTGELRTVAHLRGKAEVVGVRPPTGIGFRQLPGTVGAQVRGLARTHQQTVAAPAGKTEVEVRLAGLARQPDAGYTATVSPRFNAGGVWVSRKRGDGFLIRFTNPAGADASFDVLVTRPEVQ